MKILQASNLTKIYGSGENEVHALDGVNFSVEKGEFVAIVGTSGSGKSTLLHIINHAFPSFVLIKLNCFVIHQPESGKTAPRSP